LKNGFMKGNFGEWINVQFEVNEFNVKGSFEWKDGTKYEG